MASQERINAARLITQSTCIKMFKDDGTTVNILAYFSHSMIPDTQPPVPSSPPPYMGHAMDQPAAGFKRDWHGILVRPLHTSVSLPSVTLR
jgi:hypothetical protein